MEMKKLNNQEIKKIMLNNSCYPCEITTNIKCTYFIDRKGNKYNYGYYDNCRTEDHRLIFAIFGNYVKNNDFRDLIEKTHLLIYMPENNTGLFLKNKHLSKPQKQFLLNYNVDLIRE